MKNINNNYPLLDELMGSLPLDQNETDWKEQRATYILDRYLKIK